MDLTERSNFAFFTDITIRFSDQDDLGHINNCSYVAYVETGRVEFLGGLLEADKHPGINFILAHIAVDYIQESHYPGVMEVGSRILKLGNKSMTTGYGLFKDSACVATAKCVNIYFEEANRQTIVIPDDIRASLEADPMQRERSRGLK